MRSCYTHRHERILFEKHVNAGSGDSFLSFSSHPTRQVCREHYGPVPATGHSLPTGATLATGGANFSIFSRGAVSIKQLLSFMEQHIGCAVSDVGLLYSQRLRTMPNTVAQER